MLEQDIIQQLSSIFANIETAFTLVVSGVSAREETRQMVEFANDFASSSPAISVREINEPTEENAPVLSILKDGEETGVSFCGIPNGHEFTSLILAILNGAGQGKNLPDETLTTRIQSLSGPVDMMTFVSLTCTNCPEVVQSLNIIALLNPAYRNLTIDGGVRQELVKEYKVQSVPTVYANGNLLSVGRSDLGELVGKLEAAFGKVQDPGNVDPTPKGFDALILGGGPAGAAAAIYMARKGMKTAVIAGRIGGQVKDTMDIENLISVCKTTGPTLANDLRHNLEAYNIAVFDNRRIEEVSLVGFPKSVKADTGEVFEAPAVVIATGASWRKLEIPGEAEHIGRGVAFCTHCDGPFYAGKRVAVIGGGNSGIEAAIDLAGIATHVDVFEFMDVLRADRVLQDKLATLDNVDIHLNTSVEEIYGDAHTVSGIKVKDRSSGNEDRYDLQGVFVQIGLTPNSELFRNQILMTQRGEIEIDETCRTKVPGVYAAGDVTTVPYKQIVVAMGEGAKAALSAVDDRMRGITPE